jgi:hypothetical protein
VNSFLQEQNTTKGEGDSPGRLLHSGTHSISSHHDMHCTPSSLPFRLIFLPPHRIKYCFCGSGVRALWLGRACLLHATDGGGVEVRIKIAN